jgi:hypothetical protein
MADEKLTPEEFENLEAGLISAARNEPSDSFKVDDIRVTFRRPKLFEKYRGRVWANRKLKEIGIENLEEDEQGLVFYYRFIGALCMNVNSINKDKKNYEFKADSGYEFLLEQYLEEEINSKGLNEEPFIDKLTEAYAKWEGQTPTEDDLKKS